MHSENSFFRVDINCFFFNCYLYNYHTTIIIYRYITRTVLVPFVEGASNSGVISRMEADKILRSAIKDASKAASLAIGLDFNTAEVQSELKIILRKIEEVLPGNTHQRVKVSYGWLILCTQMVKITVAMHF